MNKEIIKMDDDVRIRLEKIQKLLKLKKRVERKLQLILNSEITYGKSKD